MEKERGREEERGEMKLRKRKRNLIRVGEVEKNRWKTTSHSIFSFSRTTTKL
jgi:hypothetical protein